LGKGKKKAVSKRNGFRVGVVLIYRYLTNDFFGGIWWYMVVIDSCYWMGYGWLLWIWLELGRCPKVISDPNYVCWGGLFELRRRLSQFYDSACLYAGNSFDSILRVLESI